MIKKVTIENIRTFKGGDWDFELRPLSVFCGTNSAGKSTLLKIPILLRQCQGINESFRSVNGKLQLVGSQLDLGTFESFVSDNDVQLDISISIRAEIRISRRQLEQVLLLQKRDLPPHLVEQPPKALIPVDVTAKFRFGRLSAEELITEPTSQLELELTAASEKEQPANSEAVLKATGFQLYLGDETILSWQSEFVFAAKNRDILHRLHISKAFFEKPLVLRTLLPESSPIENNVSVLSTIRGLVHEGMYVARRAKGMERERAAESTLDYWPLPPVISAIYRQFENLLSRIYYLGPLRSPAKRYYLTYLDAGRGLDVTGEYLPHIIREMGNSEVFKLRYNEATLNQTESFSAALNYWLYFLRTGQSINKYPYCEIRVSTMKDVFSEVTIRNLGGTEVHALADSGFGYSQVLPILAQGLLADLESTLIVEQPELHLNPALQVRLASFFVAMAVAGKQVLIETHSEHIVNAIRVLTAEDESGDLGSKCGIFFIDAGSEKPQLHELSIRSDGTVPNWPQNFFGEALSLTGRLLRAQKKRRKGKD